MSPADEHVAELPARGSPHGERHESRLEQPVVQPTEVSAADLVAAAALAVEGVAGLHGGSLGEVATYLPGRRVPGVRLRGSGTDVHLTVAFGVDVRAVAAAVQLVVAAVTAGPVEVVVEDVAEP